MSTPAAVKKLLARRAGVRIDVGCGFNKQGPEWIGIDRRKTPAVDIVHDIEVTPWPLPPNCATGVAMSHVWEHITPKRTLDVMDEIWRVCRHGASLFISAPYAMGPRYMQDPTHCNPSTEVTWLYWDPDHDLFNVYKPTARFKLVAYEVVPVGGDRDFAAVLQAVKR